MPRNKRDLEKIESFAERSEKYEGPPMEEVSAYLCGLIESALQTPSANPRPETRSIEIICDDIENEENKSRSRKDFEIYISQVADRMKRIWPKPLSVSTDGSQPEQASNSDVLLRSMNALRFLRERLN